MTRVVITHAEPDALAREVEAVLGESASTSKRRRSGAGILVRELP